MTTDEAKTIIGEDKWIEFSAYMQDKPCGTYHDGGINWPVWEVMGFVRERDIKI